MAIDLITLDKLGYVERRPLLGVYVLDEATGEVRTVRAAIA